MKKIKKLFKKLDNRGSSILLVIVALTFLGVIVAALLTAAGYSYRLKMQDLNSRDNFYYVEQAMNEIYAGVGSQTVEDMKDAYIYTVENMVYYDLVTQSYVTKDQDEVEEMFAYQFINNVKDNENFKTKDKLAAYLETLITNDSVVLDKSKLSVDYEYDGGVGGKINKIIFKNVTLTRTVNYDKNIASGSYTQTISTDIEIGEPDFDVLFNTTNQDYANIFDYSMVADMGIEVHQPGTPIVISGNIYAANDFYNKKYNESTYMIDKDSNESLVFDSTKVLGEYTHGSVTSKRLDNATLNNTYYNSYSSRKFPEVAGSNDYYDGVTKRSMYSGFFVDNSSVSVMADMMIVPGTVAVMNEGDFSLYGKNGKATSEAELWADNIVLDGTSDKKVLKTVTGNETTTYTGASMVLRANAYIKDDTELNAAGSYLTMRGKYFGFGDSTEKDARVFTSAVNKENFQVPTDDGNTENRGHYNSSAIIVNGQQATLDLSNANTIYLAGRSYIELSKDVTVEETIPTAGTTSEEGEEGTTAQAPSNVTVDEDGNTTTTTKVTEKYVYAPKGNNFLTETADDTVFIRDYKTGESISLKTNQLAYIPVMFSGMPKAVYVNDVFQGYFEAELHVGLRDSDLFEKFFPEIVFSDYKIPCVMQEISNKKYYYYDFQNAYDKMTAYSRARGEYDTFVSEYPSAQYYASAFIEAYVKELNNENSVISEYLTDIGDFEDLEFDAGSIILPDMLANPNIYSSGAITTKVGTEFNIVRSDSWDNTMIGTLLSSDNNQEAFGNGLALSTAEADLDNKKYENAYMFSNDLEMEYSLVKWNLGHYGSSADATKQAEITEEIDYIKGMVANASFGDASITPINKFVNIDEITPSINIVPKLTSSDGGNNVLDLSSGYSVWISNEDVIVSCRDTDIEYDSEGNVQQGAVRGIIVTKGDVFFDSNVTSFEGLIIAGGKVFITENLSTMNASAAICQSVLRECQLLGTENAQFVLNLFKGYEVGSGTIIATPGDAGASPEAKTIDNIDYSDVCKFNNWMKNVE